MSVDVVIVDLSVFLCVKFLDMVEVVPTMRLE